MKRDNTSIAIGALLVLGGLFFLAANFGLFRDAGALFMALVFGAGGLAFLYVFVMNIDRNWWAVFPGFALLGIGSLIGLTTLFPGVGGEIGGALFLGGLSLSFWLVYLMARERWWAVIPGGVLLTLAVIALLGSINLPFFDNIGGSIFFLGLALTFGLVYFLPTPQGRMTWAVFPAGACAVMALLVMVTTAGIINYFWPFVLIAGGLFLLYRHGVRRAE